MTDAPLRLRWKPIGLLALAFFAAARLSLLVAIPPGYATVVWPPAGIALAALWLWGLELWPGVLLGSFAANAATAWSAGAAGAAPFALALWIAAGSTGQAAFAAVLARRATGGRDPLVEERDLFRFLAIAGPLACLTASGWGVAGMLVFKTIALRQAAYSWITWWVGDSVGVVFAAPLIMLWAGRGPASARRGKLAVTAVMTATLAAAIAIHEHAIRNEESFARARAERSLTAASATLRAGIADAVDATRSVADLFESRPGVGRDEFDRFAVATLRRHPSILALEWRPRVPDARRAAFEKSPGRPFTEVAGPGRLRPRARAAEYFPILYVQPALGNGKLLGLDFGDANPARDALALALRTGEPTASGGVKLVQEKKNEYSTLILVPVRAPGAAATEGVMEGVFRVCDLVEGVLDGRDSEVKGLRVTDVTDPAAPRLLDSKGDVTRPPAGSVSANVDVAGRRWLVELMPAADFQTRGTEQTWLAVLRCLVLMYLTSWVVLTLYGRAERISALVEQKTVELREQERRLMRAQKLESVGRLAGGIAHEFNNILMGASGLAQLALLSLGPDHPSAPDLEGIVASIKRASHLVSQLLTYSRRRESNMKPTDLNGLVSGLAKMITAALGRRIDLKLEVPSEPLWMQADAGQVEQVLLNLCFNARDAEKGKGTIRISTRPVVLAEEISDAFIPPAPGSYALMEIVDDGPGIPPEVMPRLAEPFFTTKPFGEGTGLGLSVVSGIVRQHRGGLGIRTSPGAGTTMQVYWPAAAAPAEPTPPPEAAAPRGSGLVLIVDDEPLMRSTLERILAGFGYATLSASGGDEALRLLAREPKTAGVVMDLMMPGMDGLETYDRMNARIPGIKVLFLSGYAPQDSENEVARRGLPFLAKPADPARLARALHEMLA